MDTKKITFVIAGVALIYLLMKSNTIFAAPTRSKTLRGCDPLGCGNYGASRSGGTRKHGGIDFRAIPGEAIYSPISGTITRILLAYANDPKYTGIEIKNATHTVQMFYLTPTVKVGAKVISGQKVGVAQDISAKHGATMVNHVHFEVYDKKGVLINPTDLIDTTVINTNLVLKYGMYDSTEVAELQRRLGITIDGDFGQQTQAALFKAKGVKEIALKSY
ncbi:peptidoglycan DD-metalloendopeptidase family protein [Flavobacterium sp. AG291]|uniref:peptidoglycan DD-metalloendopeptidase family protein n=1 Tax=Flavobacterium sp. AG291 TaxID=2184000 RepID=UPI000E0C202F|nr:M23 family metallopeptidase [Flavobacterium sp. AG291]RDI07037.1 peptidase M23-like protein [Flavobacterium sp. AG291]